MRKGGTPSDRDAKVRRFVRRRCGSNAQITITVTGRIYTVFCRGFSKSPRIHLPFSSNQSMRPLRDDDQCVYIIG